MAKKIHAKIEIFLSISNWYMFYSDVIKNRKIKLNTQINYLLIFFVLSSLSFQKSKTEYNENLVSSLCHLQFLIEFISNDPSCFSAPRNLKSHSLAFLITLQVTYFRFFLDSVTRIWISQKPDVENQNRCIFC